MAAEPFILKPGEGRAIDLGGFLMSVKADAAATDGAFTLLEATEPPRFGPPMQIHRDAAEAFYVLEGEYIISSTTSRHAVPPVRLCTSLLELSMAFVSVISRAGSSISI